MIHRVMRLALATLIAIGGSAALLATPAQATPGSILSKAAFEDDCTSTTATITTSKTSGPYDWTVTVGGEQVWPGEDDNPLGKNDSLTLAIPATDEEIVVSGPPAALGWPKTHTWTQPDGCPAPDVQFENTCHYVKVFLANGTEATGWAQFTINGIGTVDLAPGLTPEPLVFGLLDAPLLVEEAVTGLAWEHEWVKPEDCDTTPAPVTPSPSDPPGMGGEQPPTLPDTGASNYLPLLVMGAVALAVLGGGLFVLARRRRVHFTTE